MQEQDKTRETGGMQTTGSAAPAIWVVADQRSSRFFGYSLNLLTLAAKLAAEISGHTAALLLDDGQESSDDPVCRPIPDAVEACRDHGADHIYRLSHPLLATPRAHIYAQALGDFILARKPRLVLFALTDFNRETAARVARRLHLGLIADCTDLSWTPEKGWVAACPAWGGSILAEIGFADPGQIGLATVQPHAHVARKIQGSPGNLETLAITDLTDDPRLRLVTSEPEPMGQRRLEEAEIVVAGGAGLGNAQGFNLIRELAHTLGGEVGATRPPVLQHWVDGERLIGQTGKSVRPRLLFSIGISGAVQYTAGTAEARTVVAINRDPRAPIFQTADIGVVADARSLLPLVIDRIKQTVMRQLADDLCLAPAETSGEHPVRPEGFGGKIKKLRENRNWSQAELAEATGQTPDFIQRVEQNETTPPVSFLLELGRALNVDPGTFLHDQARGVILNQRAQAFIKRTRNYSYQTFTPGAENAHLRAFMVTIEPHQAHKPVAYKHEGEEFMYVLEGELEVALGDQINRLKPGETLHFNSEIPHKLRSLSNIPTRCLHVLYTP